MYHRIPLALQYNWQQQLFDKKGEEALKQLAGVLEKNPDINIMVEGHIDVVPITGTISSSLPRIIGI